MPDIDRTIEELEKITDNNWMRTHADYYASVIGDALALLKDKSISNPPVKNGKWIYGEDETGQDGYTCSECGFFEPWYYEYNEDICFIKDYKYCPNCKAAMKSYMHEVSL